MVFYGSRNLKEWTETSRFKKVGFLGYQYECPGLAQVHIEGGRTARSSGSSSSPSIPALPSVDPLYNISSVTGTGRPSPRQMPPVSPSSPKIGTPSSRGRPTESYTVSPRLPTGSIVKPSPLLLPALFRACLSSSPSPNPLYGDWQHINHSVSLTGTIYKTLYSFADDRAVDKATTGKTIDLEGDGGFDIEASLLVPATANTT